ncbi:MAG: transcription-repair coupling factor [Gammaproteobacteria bacterium]|nr:transcription-repair coupling factor [Gammaproteobacteria bacterium]
MTELSNLFHPPLSTKTGLKTRWGRLYGSSYGLAVHNAAKLYEQPIVVITPDTPTADRLDYELRFFASTSSTINDKEKIGLDTTGHALPLLHFPDWETLPYDTFSPHQDIISDRLSTLYQLPNLKQGILVVPISTIMQRLAPREFLEHNCLLLNTGQQLDIDSLRTRLTLSSYRLVSQVMEHGEYAVRGNIIDLFPMGSRIPYRIELFDDEIETIRSFDTENQRSIDQIEHVQLLPAQEFPLNDQAISHFRQAHRVAFEGDPQRSGIYRDVSNAITPPGIEYYLPLFFENTASLFDYLPDNSIICMVDDAKGAAEHYWQDIEQRYEQRRYDIERPILPPERVFIRINELFQRTKTYAQLQLQSFKLEEKPGSYNFGTDVPPTLTVDSRAPEPTEKLTQFITSFDGRILFAAESTGRRETLIDLLKNNDLNVKKTNDWQSFISGTEQLAITISPLEKGLLLSDQSIAVIAEPQLFGEQVLQKRRRKSRQRDPDLVIKNLVELENGSPVVHEDHGVGRYIGLRKIKLGEIEQEFLTLSYAGGDKLYVPVASLHLISRYTGASPDAAPLHKLGTAQWEKAKRKARQRVHDVATELLDIYARREARVGYSYKIDKDQYTAFSSSFPFEETPDQMDAIQSVVQDMTSNKPMDRLVCGDVGFGKTEVAMRAALIAVQDAKQVVMLVPTTLLAQQHYENFKDRFADWPVSVESLSRFRTKKDQNTVITGLENGTVDIVIGTHKLLQANIKFKQLGLVIIDEEHRFGVRQKERFKALRSEVDLLTLTATPIPRTLNMSLSGLRDLSIIATAPAKRLAIKTFVNQWNDVTIQEACMREIRRGGQVFFLHNEVDTIEKMAHTIQELLPETSVEIAHGQMRERELEKVMADFYHHRFNILVCTTIIETGIDVPSANTIIMNRADRFGLAQLYQLRGRVGRSHHQAYAYLIVPTRNSMTPGAIKRLEAIESMEELGTGFTLATHDLEIRGSGELLGDEQSGQMQEIGFTMYMELLERAVNALKAGQQPELDKPLDHGTEVDLSASALIPDDYLPDIHTRLIMYKRIANAESEEALRELQVEMIDRFGLLPESAKNLFQITRIKLRASPLGIKKIEFGQDGGRIIFNEQPNIDPMKIITLIQRQPNVYKMDGTDKVRVIQDSPDLDNRTQFVNKLLDLLQGKQTA